MSVFAGVNSEAPTEQSKDSVRGQKREPVPSSIQNLIVKHAYFEKKQSGAAFVNVQLEVADNEHKERSIRLSECVASGDAKGNRTTYEKGGKTYNLPGFELINDLSVLITGKSIVNAVNENKTIKLYDYDKKAEVPTEVPVFTELTGKPICGCVVHAIEDKTAKSPQSGKYEPTGQVYHVNTIDKFLDPQKRRTVSEINNNLDPIYQEQWATKWANQVRDESTEVKGAGIKGAPVASGAAAEKTSMFG